MSGPLVILLLGAALAASAFVWRGRPTAGALVGAGGAALLGALALGIVLGEPTEVMGFGVKLEATWSVLGRSLVLGTENRPWVGFVFLSGSLALAGVAMTDAPRRTASVGLLVLLGLAAALMARPFVFSPLLLAASAIVGCFLVVRPSGEAGRAPGRLLISYVLGMMAILVAGWLIETRGVTSSPESPARAAALLLALGVAILVMTPPAHTWLTAAAEEAHPMAMVLLAVALQTSGLLFLVSLLQSYAWMRADPFVFQAARAAGLVMLLAGALACAGEQRMPRVAAYALLIDFGVLLLAVSTRTTGGLAAALGMGGARVVNAIVWAVGFSNWRKAGEISAEQRQGIARPAWLATVAGGLGLAGVPLTAGFPGRWMILEGAVDVWGRAALLAGMVSVAAAVLRWSRSAWDGSGAGGEGEIRARGIVLLGIAGLVVLLGFVPVLVFGWARPALGGLAGLMPSGLP